MIRLTVEIAADGKGKLRLENGLRSDSPDTQFQGESFAMSAFPHASAFRGKDGLGRIIWDFRDPLENWLKSGWGNGLGSRIDTERGLLILEPAENPVTKKSNFKVAQFLFSGSLFQPPKKTFPFRISIDCLEEMKGQLHLQLIENESEYWSKSNAIQFIVGTDDSNKLYELNCSADIAGEKANWFLSADRISLSKPFERVFKLPEYAGKIKVRYTAVRQAHQDGQITRLDLTAPFSASVGFTVVSTGKTLMAAQIAEKGSAKRAGVQTGDIIVLLNGKERSGEEAKQLLESVVFGDLITLTVLRSGEQKTFSFYAE